MISFFRYRGRASLFQKLEESCRSMEDSGELIATPSLQLTRASSYEYDSSNTNLSTNSATRGIFQDIGGGRSQSSRELLHDQLCNMIAQEERSGYKCCDYLSYYPKSKSSTKSKSIDEGCRTSICGWMYRVADHFAIDREVVSIALSYIDRILSTNHCADRRTFKLISATALHLAIKTHYPHMWREVGSLIPDLSRGDFGLHDLIEMEKEMTHSLTWLLNPATAQSIVMQILALLPPLTPGYCSPDTSSLNNIASTALFLTELSVCDYFFVTSKKSIVAIAAYLNASESTGYAPFESHHECGSFEVSCQNDWHILLERILADVGYVVDWHEVSAARERLWSLWRQSSESELAPHEEQHHNSYSISSPRKSPNHQGYLHEYPSPTSHQDMDREMQG